MLLALLCVGIFLVQLDVTVVNVALPSIRTGLDTSLTGQQWVVAGYMITSGRTAPHLRRVRRPDRP